MGYNGFSLRETECSHDTECELKDGYSTVLFRLVFQ